MVTMTRKMSLLALLLAVSLSGTACVSNERYESASTELENQDEVIRMLRQDLEVSKRETTEYKRRLEMSEVEAKRLRDRANAVGDVDALRAELARLRQNFSNLDRDIKVVNTPEGPALSVEGNVAFKIGSEEISERGKELLLQIAQRLKTTGKNIRVEGHSDNRPIVKLINKFPRGNLELSGRRALNVADFLIEEGGLSREMVSYAGYGAERPVSTNDTDEGRRQNRRVDIVVLNKG